MAMHLLRDLGVDFAWPDALSWCRAHAINGDTALDVIDSATAAAKIVAAADAGSGRPRVSRGR